MVPSEQILLTLVELNAGLNGGNFDQLLVYDATYVYSDRYPASLSPTEGLERSNRGALHAHGSGV